MTDVLIGDSPQTVADRRRWIALGVVCLGQLMMILDMTIVNVALPSIQRDLSFSQANLTWVVNAYLIALGSFLLLAGRIGDLVGRKRVFLSGLAVFTAASVLCGLAQDQTMLIASRFVQGLGGGVAMSVIVALIVTEFPEPIDRAKAMSVYTFVVASGGSIGLLAGGVLTEAISWHWIFFVNVPIGLATLALAKRFIQENAGIGLTRDVDVLGSILVTAGMMLGVYAIVTSADHGWGSAHTLGLGAGAVALLVAFLGLEARLRNPIMPLRILRVRGLASASALRGFMVIGMFASFFMGALYLEHVRGYSPIENGLAFMPMTLALAALSLGITARLMQRFGPLRVLVVGMAAAIAGLLLLSTVGEDAGYMPTVFVAFVILGIGAGLAFLPILTLAMANVPARDAGLASGIVNVSMQLAAALGVAVLGTVATDRTQALTDQGQSAASALTSGYHLAFVIGAAIVAVGIVLALVTQRAPAAAKETVSAEAEPQAA